MAAPIRESFRNNIVVFAWVVVAVFNLFAGIFVWLTLRDGAPPGWPPPLFGLVVGGYVLAGLAAAAQVFRMPRTRIDIDAGGNIVVSERRPWSLARRHYGLADVSDVAVEESTDSDGDPYFRTRVRFADGTEIVAQEGHARAESEAARRRFLVAIDRDPAMPPERAHPSAR